MEKDIFLIGYCRALDQSRIVEAEISGQDVSADCAYPDCTHMCNCQIAQKIREIK